MNRGTINFAASNVESGWGDFDLEITQAEIRAHSHFSGETGGWQLFGQQLQGFPSHLTSRVALETRVSEPSIHGYLLLEAYCYDAMGHTALRVIADNMEQEPFRQRMEFSIPAEVASLNKLGQLLANWQVADNTEVQWQAQTS